MIRVGSRRPAARGSGSSSAARSAIAVTAAVAGIAAIAALAVGAGAPGVAHAAAEYPLTARIEVTHGEGQDGQPGETVERLQWELPADAAPGDTVRVSLPEYPGGAVTGADWIAASGASIGTARVTDDGAMIIALSEAAADPANRFGATLVRSVGVETPPVTHIGSSDADATLRPGDRPGGFFGVADRERGNKYGAWTDDSETVAQWRLDGPRGPWDTLDIVDRRSPGQRIDCASGIRVRSTTTVDPSAGYLIGLADLSSDRVDVSCTEEELSVRISPVRADEIVEVTLTTIAESPSTTIRNTASFAGSFTEPGSSTRVVGIEPVPVTPVEPAPTASPAPPTVSPVSPTPVPPLTESSGEPTPAAVASTPGPGVPTRLATTGSGAPLAALAFAGATLAAVGAGAVLVRGIRERRSS